jgi:hypothetical protein
MDVLELSLLFINSSILVASTPAKFQDNFKISSSSSEPCGEVMMM